MKLAIYSLEQKKNRIGYYLFHVVIGGMVLGAIKILYANFFVDKELFIHGMQFLLIALVSYVGGNFLMLRGNRGNRGKRKYIKLGILILGAIIGVGIIIETILEVV